jgi:hypothetical protein
MLKRPESFDFDIFDGNRTWLQNGEQHFDFDGDGDSDFSQSDADFDIRSLKLNAVLRWEYRPGSTIFIVWQHSRNSEKSIGYFDLGDSLNSLWRTRPDNVIIIKLNYWLGV